MSTPHTKEGSTVFITVSFYDKAGVLETPASATYTIYDKGSGDKLEEDVDMTPIADTFEIIIVPATNTLKEDQEEETRQVVVTALYSGTQAHVETYEYTLRSAQAGD